jgi:PleD family two-component response regulator
METRNETILIVDDHPANIKILGEALGADYEVLFATSGQEAMDIVQDQIPTLILLDIVMPGMNGYEVCRNLKRIPALKDIPVIFITALDKETDETTGLELGAVDYITKPFNPAIVRLRVLNQMELKRRQSALMVQNEELQKALTEIKTLSGLLPICAWCKKVRDDQGYWEQIEVYIRDRSEVSFTHGVCPECAKKLVPSSTSAEHE